MKKDYEKIHIKLVRWLFLYMEGLQLSGKAKTAVVFHSVTEYIICGQKICKDGQESENVMGGQGSTAEQKPNYWQ